LRYDVLYHTDLSRTSGYSNGIPLDRINWSNYDLVVIDESHNFRNGGDISDGIDDEEDGGKENRYERLMNQVIRKGVKTKVLMLSATPVNNRFSDLKNQLAGILQIIYEEDQTSLIEILLSGADISEFFDNLVALETLDEKSHDFLQEIKGLKTSLEGQKQSLDTEKGDLESALKMQTLQKQESQNVQKQQEYFLQLTEVQYQQYLKEKQATEAKAAEIRARIFEVAGITKAPTFGEAYSIAKWVEGLTGARPAFLLAVLQQESAIGKNVGQCYLSDASTGVGVNINTGASIKNVMKPMGLSGRKGDVEDFLTITKELGMDPYKTPVSCPIPSVGGYGGAMGPAQFIPTTWMIYKSDLQRILGRPANPWNIQDAFRASGLYLARYGAAKQTRDAEWAAAMYYFAGSLNSKYSFYANSVLKIADGFADDIAILEASK
jgi:membrane-bound lytic murein transglycosylase B